MAHTYMFFLTIYNLVNKWDFTSDFKNQNTISAHTLTQSTKEPFC